MTKIPFSSRIESAAADVGPFAPSQTNFARTQRTTHLDWLAGNNCGHRMAHVHRVRVHHPRHYAFVRVHVGRWNVGVRSESLDDADRVTTRQTLQFAHAHLERVANYTTLRTTEGNVHDSTLPC